MAHFPWDLERAPSLITVLLATFTAAAPIGRTVLPSVSNQPTYQPSLHLGGKVHKFLVKSSSVATITARPSQQCNGLSLYKSWPSCARSESRGAKRKNVRHFNIYDFQSIVQMTLQLSVEITFDSNELCRAKPSKLVSTIFLIQIQVDICRHFFNEG